MAPDPRPPLGIDPDTEEITDFFARSRDVEPDSPLETVAILRREFGGGETLVATVCWDGVRVRWERIDLTPERLEEIRRLVLASTGLWPGHGRAYLQAVVATLVDPERRCRWEARWVRAGAA